MAKATAAVTAASPRTYKHLYNIDTLNILNMKRMKQCKVLHTTGGGGEGTSPQSRDHCGDGGGDQDRDEDGEF